MEAMSVVEACRLLQRQWRFAELHEKASAVPEGHPDFLILQYIRFEAFLSRQDLTSAREIYDETIALLDPGSQLFISFRLRYLYMQVLSFEKSDFTAAELFFEQVQADSLSSKYNKALAYSLQGRALSIGISFGFKSAREKPRFLALIRTAADIFREDADPVSYAKELQLLAEHYRHVPFPDVPASKATLKEWLVLGDNMQDSLILGEAQTFQLEMDLEDAFNSQGRLVSFESVINSVRATSLHYQSGGHLCPLARVKERFGSGLLRFAVKEGIAYLEDAIEEYHSNGFIIEAQALHRQIAIWHLEHGNTQENIIAEKFAASLDQQIRSNTGSMVSYLGLIERAFREGRIDRARALYESGIEEFQQHPLLKQLITLQANNLGKVGHHEESIALFQEVVNLYSPLEVSAFLSDAHTNLAGALKDHHAEESLVQIKKAIDIDGILGDHIAMAQHIQLVVQVLVTLQGKKYGQPLVITEEIESSLDLCENILKADRSLKAFTVSGQNMQTRALVFFMAGDYDRAIEFYETAGELFTRYELHSNLGFLYSHLGITLISKARKTLSKAHYSKAQEKLALAIDNFNMTGLLEEKSRVNGLIGISLLESGRLQAGTEHALQCWKEAEAYFEESYQIATFLRNHVDNSTALSSQVSMITIIGGGQTYPEQALYLHLNHTKDVRKAIKWLERTKAQALLLAMEKNRKSVDPSLVPQEVDQLYLEDQDDLPTIADAVLGEIPADTLVVQYYYSNTKVYVFGIRKSWAIPEMIEFPFDLEAFEECISMHFSPLFGNVKSMLDNQLEDQWQAFRSLVAPIEAWSDESEQVCIIPHAILHQLPLHALKTSGDSYLIERNPVLYNQSLSVLFHQTQRRKTKTRNIVMHHVFGNSRSNLRFSELEARQVANLLGVDVKLGSQVTKQSLMDCLQDASILHVSGHGELSGGWGNGLLMAGDEKLTAADVIACKSNLDLVVMSGCDTGINHYSAGDELTGLVRSFIYAGADQLIVSLWKVNDAATADFYGIFYAGLIYDPAKPIAVVLRETVRQQIEKGMNFFYWGAFQLIGTLN